jgi:hypothetical protein
MIFLVFDTKNLPLSTREQIRDASRPAISQALLAANRRRRVHSIPDPQETSSVGSVGRLDGNEEPEVDGPHKPSRRDEPRKRA